jgi:hypothetical protein
VVVVNGFDDLVAFSGVFFNSFTGLVDLLFDFIFSVDPISVLVPSFASDV